ncbi:MAG: hypothetical protein QXS37_00850 [Candidatus Aenigmatarchaeota archaeon]
MPIIVFKIPEELNTLLEGECKQTGLKKAELLRHIILTYYKVEMDER